MSENRSIFVDLKPLWLRFNTMSSSLISRYFSTKDRVIDTICWEDIRFDLCENLWWSRRYEYAWIADVYKEYFASCRYRHHLCALDLATGYKHPTPFILSSLGFQKVVCSDIVELEQMQCAGYFRNGITYTQIDVTKQISIMADCVTCISLLEHISKEDQKAAVQNIATCVKPNGCVLLTFDVAKSATAVDIGTIYGVLRHNGFNYYTESVLHQERLNSGTALYANDVCKKWNLWCYRLFAWRS